MVVASIYLPAASSSSTRSPRVQTPSEPDIQEGRLPPVVEDEATQPPDPPYPGPGGAIWLLVLTFLAAIGTGFVVRVAGLEDEPLVSLLMQMVLPTVLVAWYAWRRRGEPSSRLFAWPRIPATAVGALMVALAGFWVVLFHGLALLMAAFPVPPELAELLEDRFLGPWLPVSALVLTAVVAEEVLFRGVILAGLLERYAVVPAIVGSALLFGLAHVLPWAIFSAFLGGLLLGWLYYRTRSILLCIVVHGLHNLGAEHFMGGVARVAGIEGWALSQEVVPPLPLPVVAIGVVLAVTGFVLADRGLRRADVDQQSV